MTTAKAGAVAIEEPCEELLIALCVEVCVYLHGGVRAYGSDAGDTSFAAHRGQVCMAETLPSWANATVAGTR